MENRYVLVGGGLAADAAAKAIRAADGDGSIVLVTSEADGPYRRPQLSKALWNGSTEEKAYLGTERHGVELRIGRTVTGLDHEAKRLELDDGTEIGYDQVLLATGARARSLPGLPAGGPIVPYRTMRDFRTAKERSGEGRSALVVGGGFVGAELAAGLAKAGTEVHMAFPEPGIGANRFPPGLAAALVRRYEERGVTVHAGAVVEAGEVVGDQARVRLGDGTVHSFDLVAVGVGAAPNAGLAEASGLQVAGGIVVDEYLRALDASGEPAHAVFVAGDVAVFPWSQPFGRTRIEHEDAAVTMGAHAGRQMVAAAKGEPLQPYTHLPFFYSDLFDDGYEAVGVLDGRLSLLEDWQVPNSEGVIYYVDGDRLRGVLLWNTWGQVDAARDLLLADPPVGVDSLKGRLPQ